MRRQSHGASIAGVPQNAGQPTVHDLGERLTPSLLAAVWNMLEVMTDPVARAIASAPLDDEPESEDERRSVARSKEWFKDNPKGIPHEEVLADLGLTPPGPGTAH